MAEWKPTPTPHHDVAPGFHVPYEVKECAFGKGLFATVAIPAGTLLWKHKPGSNVLSFATEAEARARLQQLPEAERAYWMDHVYMFDGKLNEIIDEGKLWNHSETPCTGLPPPGDEYCYESSYSIRDIAAGEECKSCPAHAHSHAHSHAHACVCSVFVCVVCDSVIV